MKPILKFFVGAAAIFNRGAALNSNLSNSVEALQGMSGDLDEIRVDLLPDPRAEARNFYVEYFKPGVMKKSDSKLADDLRFAAEKVALAAGSTLSNPTDLCQQALKMINHAIDLNPDDPLLYHSRGIYRKSLGDIEGAKEDFSKMLERNISPGLSFLAYFERGEIYMMEGQYEKSTSDFLQVISLNTYEDKVKIAREAIDAAKFLVELAKAKEKSEAVIQDFAERPDIQNNKHLKKIYDQIISYDSTISLVRSLVHFRYVNLPSEFFLNSQSSTTLNHFESDHSKYRVRFGVEKNLKHDLGVGINYIKLGCYEDALAEFSAPIKNNPKSTDLRYRAFANKALGREKEAEDDLEEANRKEKQDYYYKILEALGVAGLAAVAAAALLVANPGLIRDFMILGEQQVANPEQQVADPEQQRIAFRHGKELEDSIKGFARISASILLGTEDQVALLKLSKKEAEKIFEQIFVLETAEEIENFLNEKLSEIPEGQELNDLLAPIAIQGVGLKKIIPPEQDTQRKENNYIYNYAVPAGTPRHHPLNREKLQQFIKIFEDETSRYMLEIHEEVHNNEDIKNLINNLVSEVERTEEPTIFVAEAMASQVSVKSKDQSQL